MEFLSVFLDLTKISALRRKDADVSRKQEVCCVIYAFLDILYVSNNCTKFRHCGICVTEQILSPLFQ